MVGNCFKIALRNLFRKRFFTLILILGLTIGLTLTTLLLVYIYHELNYDRFFPDSENLYRVVTTAETQQGQELILPMTLYRVSDSLKKHFPEIESIGRLFLKPGFFYENRQYNFGHIRFCYVEPSFFSVFSMPGITGTELNHLHEPYTAIITKSFADQLFPGEEAIGQQITIHNDNFTIVAITDDIPPNSHMEFNLFLSLATLEETGELAIRGSLDFTTYIRIAKGKNRPELVDTIEIRIDDWANEHYHESGAVIYTKLQKVYDIHLHSSEIGYNFKAPGRTENILIFGTIAILILIIAISNYIILVLADSANRVREVGIRKVLGADRKALVIQFMSESFIISFLSLLLSFLLVHLLLPIFGTLVDRPFTLPYWSNPLIPSGMVLLTLIICLIAGYYPVLSLFRYRYIEDLQMHGMKIRSRGLKTASVFIQLTISAFMITVLLVMYKQVVFLKRTDLGFDPENLVAFYKVNRYFSKPFEPVREKLLEHPEIMSVSASDALPGNVVIIQNAWLSEGSPENAFIIKENPIQDDFLETFGIKLVAGRDFLNDLDEDTGKFIINESAAEKLNLKNPMGKSLNVYNHRDTIIGVVKDFHFESLYQPIMPVVFTRFRRDYQYITLRLKEGLRQDIIDFIQKTLQGYYEDTAFDYYSVDQQIRSKYSVDEQNTKLMLLGTLLALVASAFGLYGLISFSVVKRTKEMGIRKVMGAGSRSIVMLMIGDFGKFVIPAIALAIPFAMIMIKNWMQNFAYRVELSGWIYLVSTGIALLIALLAILVRVIHFANSNPAESLRYE